MSYATCETNRANKISKTLENQSDAWVFERNRVMTFGSFVTDLNHWYEISNLAT